jgi:hypothetical protein
MATNPYQLCDDCGEEGGNHAAGCPTWEPLIDAMYHGTYGTGRSDGFVEELRRLAEAS